MGYIFSTISDWNLLSLSTSEAGLQVIVFLGVISRHKGSCHGNPWHPTCTTCPGTKLARKVVFVRKRER